MTRILLSAFAGLLALTMATPSSAADLPRKAAPYYVAPYFSWTGFYAGINGGYGWGNSNWTNVGGTTGDFRVKGALAGATLGYNLQTGVWVWGLEGDIDYSWIDGSTTQFCGAPGCQTRNRWLGTVRGRIGYAFDRWLPYITGGAAIGDLKMTPAGGASDTKTKVGWTLGGGVEYAFLGSWSVKACLLYTSPSPRD